MSEYLSDFVQDSQEQITTLNNSLLTLERSPDDQEALRRTFRAAHTLKGNCGAMGLEQASDLAHAIEDLLDEVRAGDAEVSGDLMDTVFDGVDELERIIDEVASSGEIQTDPTEVIEALYAQTETGRDSSSLSSPSDEEIDAVLEPFDPPADDDHHAYFVRLSIDGDADVNNGHLVVEALTDAFDVIGTDPPREAIEAGEYEHALDAVFASPVQKEAIVAALEPVDAVVDFEITVVTDRFETGSDEPDIDVGSEISAEDANELSVDELLDELSEFDDLDALAEEVEDVDAFEDMGDAGTFDDLLEDEDVDDLATEPTVDDADADDERADASADDETDQVDDATAVFEELKDEVEMVGFDELQDELDELEFDEFDDEDEISMEELLGDDVDLEDDSFLDDSDPLLEDEADGADESEGEIESAEPALEAGSAVDDRDETASEESVPEAFSFDDLPGEVADVTAEAAADAVEADDAETSVETVEADDAETPVETVEADDAETSVETVEADDAETPVETVEADDAETSVETVEADDTETPAETVEADDTETPVETGEADDIEAPVETVEADDAEASVETGEADDAETPVETGEADDAETPVETGEADDAETPVETGEADDAETPVEADDAETEPERPTDDPDTPAVDEESVTTPSTVEDDDESVDDLESPATTDAFEETIDAVETEEFADAVLGDDGLDEAELAAETDEFGDAVFGNDGFDSADPRFEDTIEDDPFADSPVDSFDHDASDLELDDEFEAPAAGEDEFDAPSTEFDPASELGEPAADTADLEADDQYTSTPLADEFDSDQLAAEQSSDDDGDDSIQSVRVDVDQIDSLLTLVEGLVTSRVRLRHAIETGADLMTIDRELDGLADLTTELQETVMDVRLVPLETAVNRLPRVVRDIAREQNKEVVLELEGEEVELDRSILDEIGDPLIHMVRNAVDHGIEPPDEREAAGKPREGTVELRADRSRDRVTIEIEDDGAGLDPDRLRTEAVEAGVLSAAEADALEDEEVYDLVFHSGLSTAEEVTDISGRGVGMDVVRRTIDELDGSVTVESAPGEGTTFTLTLPVTMAIEDVLFVESGGEEFGVPTKVIGDVETVTAVEVDEERGVLETDEAEFSIVDLAAELDTPGDGVGDDGMFVRIRDEVRPVAIQCDEIRGQQEVVVKPFEGFMKNIPGLSGATVRGRGEVVNILDVTSL
ncbi:ATP-binding protein [Natronobeatus ordinarius]|uniref:ATP-binding protein n=1 Tax=Natronobeatus ordinarius TaxID=2963433 RepID=UPI0020CDF5E1|nr:ATP-binding protein [Natronobeatus ordinarius]